jgi:hypothetical protein
MSTARYILLLLPGLYQLLILVVHIASGFTGVARNLTVTFQTLGVYE